MIDSRIQRLGKLLEALDFLSQQESDLLREKLLEELPVIQDKMLLLMKEIGPLTDQLKSEGKLSAQHRKQAARIMELEAKTLQKLQADKNEVETELIQLQTASSRVNRVRPVYGYALSRGDRRSQSSLDAQG